MQIKSGAIAILSCIVYSEAFLPNYSVKKPTKATIVDLHRTDGNWWIGPTVAAISGIVLAADIATAVPPIKSAPLEVTSGKKGKGI